MTRLIYKMQFMAHSTLFHSFEPSQSSKCELSSETDKVGI